MASLFRWRFYSVVRSDVRSFGRSFGRSFVLLPRAASASVRRLDGWLLTSVVDDDDDERQRCDGGEDRGTRRVKGKEMYRERMDGEAF
jgi:hypothetical protein